MPEYRVFTWRGKYAVEWWEGKQRRRSSLGTSDKLQIDAALRRLDEKLQAKRRPDVVTVAHAWAAKRAALTLRPAGEAMDSRWKALEPHFGSMRADHITEEDCDIYIARRRSAGRGDGTILAELKQLRACLHESNT